MEKSYGDTACDSRFGEMTLEKKLGGHCLRFEIWGLDSLKNLGGTPFAI